MFGRFGRRFGRRRRCWNFGVDYGYWPTEYQPRYGRGFGRGWGNKPWVTGGYGRRFFGMGLGMGRMWRYQLFPWDSEQMTEDSQKPNKSTYIEHLPDDPIEKAKAILREATLGVPAPGDFLIPIYYKGEIVGYLWSSAPLSKVRPGNIHNVNGETRVALIYDDKIVGYVRV